MPIPWHKYIPNALQTPGRGPLLPIAEVRESPTPHGTPLPPQDDSFENGFFENVVDPERGDDDASSERNTPSPGGEGLYTELGEDDIGPHEIDPEKAVLATVEEDDDQIQPVRQQGKFLFSDPFANGDELPPSTSSDASVKSIHGASPGRRNSSLPERVRNFSLPVNTVNPKGLTWIPDPNTWPAYDDQIFGGTIRPKSMRTMSTISVKSEYPQIVEPKDPARKLSPNNLFFQRCLFFGTIIGLNLGCLIAALFGHQGTWVFIFILIVKSKDVLSSIISPTGMLLRAIHHLFKPPKEVPTKWILSLIPAYSESEEQIIKCILSLRDNGVEPHRQIMCVVLDGKPRDIKSHFTHTIASFERPYVSFKHKLGDLVVDAGFIEDVPVIVIEKTRNGGKKDSLILAHDLFNYPRENMPLYTQLLRDEVWEHLLPLLTEDYVFEGFDMIFCTDADSVIHRGALKSLTDALARKESSIAACGLVLVELEPGYEWSMWNLYQQFQYTFGQYVRRRAEHFWGKVSCLPGCITMIKVRPECAGAMEKYAEAITVMPVLHHQVQYLGTDRRLTYSMLSQSKKLTTIFVPEAVSETVAPQSLKHYLSQRRRWGSNAYFNNYFYMMGRNMIPITRAAAFVEILRLSMVYYRFCNTILLIKFIIQEVLRGTFNTTKLIPLLCVSQLPLLWYIVSVIIEKPLRVRAHKLVLGFFINKCISPFISMTTFFNVLRNVGSQVWGMSGVTATSANTAANKEAGATPSTSIPTVEVPAIPISTTGPGDEKTLVPAAAVPGEAAAEIARARRGSVPTVTVPAIAVPSFAIPVISAPETTVSPTARRVSFAAFPVIVEPEPAAQAYGRRSSHA
ncbi:hypothetical protein LTR10_018052 [Elasticomyces elasticus]|uniref:chitin synthase n=1 Tax=Exophiala sideris TaxID=1016849 RepID=A0ABR0JRH0_9EURO|nr:hypothetical protein LTR10_018052 [Elasticomyces elasticus]KAK5039544.1 hypothetical protein LTS07_000038 [Exophiala sideris]KAK5041097.1 hypothetical protein LTR13_002571 [Exophiala sideris]KAK5067921.1 hypothetical protein LTR69_000038 [Exophiala sideris]KAK5187223.1 hypothetical protein LTR44_000038 [Eurotiomycetes sp. CCFEE 6388]